MPIVTRLMRHSSNSGLARQDGLINSRGLVEIPLQLQRDGFAEQRRNVVGLLLEHAIEAFRRRIRFFQMQVRDAQPQPGIQTLRLRLRRLFEEVRGFLPASQPLQTHREVQVRVGVLGMHAEQFGVALGRILVQLQLELDLRLGGKDLQRTIPGRDRAVDFIQGFGESSLHVQGNRDG